MNRSALTATARLCVEPAPGRQVMRWSQSWPVVLRRTGADRVHLVHGAGGPLGGDAFALELTVAAAGVLRVGSAGATIVQPGAGADRQAARWHVRADVGAGGYLHWAPEPTVVCDGAELHAGLTVRLDRDAGAVLREVVVLGRHGQLGGRYRGELIVDVDGAPLLAQRTLLDGTDPALCGPAGTAGARAVGTLLVAGTAVAGTAVAGEMQTGAAETTGVRWAWTELAGPGRMLMAVGAPGEVMDLLDRAAEAHRPRSVAASDCS